MKLEKILNLREDLSQPVGDNPLKQYVLCISIINIKCLISTIYISLTALGKLMHLLRHAGNVR